MKKIGLIILIFTAICIVALAFFESKIDGLYALVCADMEAAFLVEGKLAGEREAK